MATTSGDPVVSAQAGGYILQKEVLQMEQNATQDNTPRQPSQIQSQSYLQQKWNNIPLDPHGNPSFKALGSDNTQQSIRAVFTDADIVEMVNGYLFNTKQHQGSVAAQQAQYSR